MRITLRVDSTITHIVFLVSIFCQSVFLLNFQEKRIVYLFGTARIILGHRSAAITEVYAELDQQKAMEASVRVG